MEASVTVLKGTQSWAFSSSSAVVDDGEAFEGGRMVASMRRKVAEMVTSLCGRIAATTAGAVGPRLLRCRETRISMGRKVMTVTSAGKLPSPTAAI